MTFVKKYIFEIILIVVLIVLTLAFYSPMFAYQEGLQIFMFNREFFVDTVLRPGGLCDYIGSFFVQFFMYTHYLIIILILFSLAVYVLIKKLFGFLSAVLSAVAMIGLFFSFNVMFGAEIAILLSLLAVKITCFTKNIFVLSTLSIVIYFFLGGLGCLIFILGVFTKTNWKVMLASGLVLVFSCLITKNIMQDDGLSAVFTGVDFNRYPENICYAFWAAFAMIVLSEVLPLKKIESKKLKAVVISLSSIFWIAFLYSNYDWQRMLFYKVDKMVRYKQWDNIISCLEGKKISDPLIQCYLNMSLNERGIMDSKMFNFSQSDVNGLYSVSVDSQRKSIVNCEIYFRLGIVNIAERLAIDSHESNNTFQKSARQYKRLAEIAIVKNDKPLAIRYLNKLISTTFYSSWAKEALRYIQNPEANSGLADWKIKPVKGSFEFFFNPSYKSEFFFYLLGNDQQNRKLFNYYTCSLLLEKKVSSLYNFISQCNLEKPVGVHVYEGIGIFTQKYTPKGSYNDFYKK